MPWRAGAAGCVRLPASNRAPNPQGTLEQPNRVAFGSLATSATDTITSLAAKTYAIALGDFDVDGDEDLLLGNIEGDNELYRNGSRTMAREPWTSTFLPAAHLVCSSARGHRWWWTFHASDHRLHWRACGCLVVWLRLRGATEPTAASNSQRRGLSTPL